MLALTPSGGRWLGRCWSMSECGGDRHPFSQVSANREQRCLPASPSVTASARFRWEGCSGLLSAGSELKAGPGPASGTDGTDLGARPSWARPGSPGSCRRSSHRCQAGGAHLRGQLAAPHPHPRPWPALGLIPGPISEPCASCPWGLAAHRGRRGAL